MGSLLCSVQLFSFNNCCTSIIMRWFLVVLCIQATFASRVKRGGACETTAECVAPNVCSKWGWCRWTKIYGEEGPSQGASAPAGGRAGQCKTSADCASRVPYCSKLGFCHGGRLPFDEAQLEIVGDEEAQGFINNNPRKNSPILKKSQSTSSARTGTNTRPKNGGNGRTQTGNGQRKSGNGRGGGNKQNRRQQQSNQQRRRPSNKNTSAQASGGECPGGSVDACIDEACVPLENVIVYAACAKGCGKRCPNK